MNVKRKNGIPRAGYSNHKDNQTITTGDFTIQHRPTSPLKEPAVIAAIAVLSLLVLIFGVIILRCRARLSTHNLKTPRD